MASNDALCIVQRRRFDHRQGSRGAPLSIGRHAGGSGACIFYQPRTAPLDSLDGVIFEYSIRYAARRQHRTVRKCRRQRVMRRGKFSWGFAFMAVVFAPWAARFALSFRGGSGGAGSSAMRTPLIPLGWAIWCLRPAGKDPLQARVAATAF